MTVSITTISATAADGAFSLALGPGRYALDAMLFKKRDRVAEEKREWLKSA